MAVAAGHDVVLLNSDTEVPKGWLRRMAGHAYSDPMVGTVTPYSNNATICSYPTFGGGGLPFGKSLAELDGAAQAANAGRSVTIPTAVGFAMYIRRDCLDAIGSFDEQRFGRGYGEENDFCMRATKAGWVHKLACDVFVYHAGEVSFGKDSSDRNRACARIVELHPDYPAAVASHIERDPGAGYRFALTAKLFSEGREPVTLLISHSLGGGTERCIRERIDSAVGRIHWVLLRPVGRGVSIEIPEIENHPVLELSPDHCQELIHALRSMGLDRIHIHHLAGFPISVRTIVEALGKPFDFTVHDYFAICPQINMLPDPAGEHCNEPEEAVCNACIAVRRSFDASDIFSWRRRFGWLFLDADRVFCPDQDVRDRLDRFGLAERAAVVPHEPPVLATWQPQHRLLTLDQPMRIAVLGVLAPLKGLRVFENCVRMVDPGSYKFIVIGTIDANHLASDVRLRAEVTGPYKETDLPQLLEIHAPHVIWFPGLVPETYSYTLSSALAARMPLISGDIGAIPSRTRGRPWTLHVKPSLSPGGWLEAFEHMRKSMLAGVWVEPLKKPSADRRISNLAKRGPLRRGRSKPILILPDRFSNGAPTPCGYIRLLLPYDDLASAGEARIDLIDAHELAHVTGSAVIAQRHAAKTIEAADELIAACRAKGMPLIYDLDDNLAIDIPSWHPEVEFLTEMASVVRRFLDRADIVAASTPALAKTLAPLCNRCVVVENTLDTRVWGDMGEQVERFETDGDRGRPIRMLYLGTATHDAEYQMLQSCFRELKAKYGNGLMIDILGMTNRQLDGDVNRLTPPSSDYLALAEWLRTQPSWDIGLAPLVANSFNECKSQIKLLDYTALGLAVIASDETPYRGEIAQAGGVLLVQNRHEAWVAGIVSLIESSTRRSQMCSAARRVIRSRFITARRRHERASLIGSLVFSNGQASGETSALGTGPLGASI
jgi:glycosyltransferase involved in cell wall biosynthesis